MFSFTNEDGKVVDISFGKDDNEVCVTGQSATQYNTIQYNTIYFMSLT